MCDGVSHIIKIPAGFLKKKYYLHIVRYVARLYEVLKQDLVNLSRVRVFMKPVQTDSPLDGNNRRRGVILNKSKYT